jgi:hypothetical protein
MVRFLNPLKWGLVATVLFLVCGCTLLGDTASDRKDVKDVLPNPAKDAQSYAQSAQQAATCAMMYAPNSAPARMAAAKASDAAQAAAANAASDLAAKRAAADKALSDAKAAEAALWPPHHNSNHAAAAFCEAERARNQVIVNAMTPDERIAYAPSDGCSLGAGSGFDDPIGGTTERMNVSSSRDEIQNRVMATPEYIATQKAMSDRHREFQTAKREVDAAQRAYLAASSRAEAAQAEADRAATAANAGNDTAYTSMVSARQHALNASPNCSHVAGVEQPPRDPTVDIIRSLIPGIGIGVGGFGGGGGGRSSGGGRSGEGPR